jgi:hypothetical protein
LSYLILIGILSVKAPLQYKPRESYRQGKMVSSQASSSFPSQRNVVHSNGPLLALAVVQALKVKDPAIVKKQLGQASTYSSYFSHRYSDLFPDSSLSLKSGSLL